MVMSVGFSIVFYHVSARELSRPAPPTGVSRVFSFDNRLVFDDILKQRAAEGRKRLLINLMLVNMAALAGGSYLSYYLARRTLRPIEQAMEMQSRFASDASHELRTPLAAIQAESEVALRKPNLTLARAKELLRSNLEEANKLRALAEGLLQLTQAENSTATRKPVQLLDIVADALNKVVAPAQAKAISIEDTVQPLTISGDERLLTQAIVILLDNAIKYSPAKTTIRLVGERGGKQAVIRVIDQGPGLKATDQTHIFERFYRADPSRSNQHTPGYGLGLSIACKIIELHHGTISVSSIVGHGATFTIRLPL
jgi:two-component system, OmpR family, sensor histidine kinase CiaH